MKILAVGVLSTTLAAGLVGSVAAYRSQIAQEPDAERPTTSAVETRSAKRSAAPRVRWAPCPADSKLERGVCVTDVVRTVVLPAPAPAPAPVVPARATGPEERDADSDDRDDEREDADVDEGDDDNDHEDDDHDDDHDEDQDEDEDEDEDD